MLVQVAARRRELAIRAALGASRTRILALVGVDSFLLALAGGLSGVLLSAWAIDLVRRFRPAELISLSGLTIDRAALLFAAAASFVTALLFGLLPALSIMRLDLAKPIAAGGGSARTTARGGLRAALVTGEVALSLVLLVGATLLVRSLLYLQHRDLGFNTENLMVAQLELPEDAFPNADSRRAAIDGVRTQLSAIPGIRGIALGETPPGLGVMFGQLELEDQPERKDLPSTLGGAQIEADLFDVLGIRVLRGRTFTMRAEDRDNVVINEAMAEKYWPGQSALGKRFRMSKTGNWWTVVGVAQNIAASGPQHASSAPLAFHRFDYDFGFASLVIPYSGDGAEVMTAVRNVLARADERISVTLVTTMQQKVAETMARDRFSMALLIAFALCALLLCIVGLYGVVSQAVTQSTREIGVRVALGASPGNIRGWVLGHATKITALGVLLGCLGAYAAARLAASMLHGVRAGDPLSFVLSVSVLSFCALTASWLPVRRATRVDPINALRSE
jgi:predicted permease